MGLIMYMGKTSFSFIIIVIFQSGSKMRLKKLFIKISSGNSVIIEVFCSVSVQSEFNTDFLWVDNFVSYSVNRFLFFCVIHSLPLI